MQAWIDCRWQHIRPPNLGRDYYRKVAAAMKLLGQGTMYLPAPPHELLASTRRKAVALGRRAHRQRLRAMRRKARGITVRRKREPLWKRIQRLAAGR